MSPLLGWVVAHPPLWLNGRRCRFRNHQTFGTVQPGNERPSGSGVCVFVRLCSDRKHKGRSQQKIDRLRMMMNWRLGAWGLGCYCWTRRNDYLMSHAWPTKRFYQIVKQRCLSSNPITTPAIVRRDNSDQTEWTVLGWLEVAVVVAAGAKNSMGGRVYVEGGTTMGKPAVFFLTTTLFWQLLVHFILYTSKEAERERERDRADQPVPFIYFQSINGGVVRS